VGRTGCTLNDRFCTRLGLASRSRTALANRRLEPPFPVCRPARTENPHKMNDLLDRRRRDVTLTLRLSREREPYNVTSSRLEAAVQCIKPAKEYVDA